MALQEIVSFAQDMELKLRKNAHEDEPGCNSGWESCSVEYLTSRLVQEVGELLRAIEKGESLDCVQAECADVGNFTMMIHSRALEAKAQGRERLHDGM